MARIAGVDLPKNKRGEIGLTYIYGIGPSTAKYILDKHNIDRNKKVNDWNDDDLNAIRNTITGVLSACLILLVTGAFGIVKDCRFVASVQEQIAVQEKENVKQ